MTKKITPYNIKYIAEEERKKLTQLKLELYDIEKHPGRDDNEEEEDDDEDGNNNNY